MNKHQIQEIVNETTKSVYQANLQSLLDKFSTIQTQETNNSSKYAEIYAAIIQHIYKDMSQIIGESISRVLENN